MGFVKEIVVAFYFVYWIVHNSTPFSVWWIIGIYILIYIFEILITSILKKSSDKIEEKAKDIDETIEGFNNRLNKLEVLT